MACDGLNEKGRPGGIGRFGHRDGGLIGSFLHVPFSMSRSSY